VPGFVGAHSQGETLDELRENLQEVIEMLLEDSAITAVEDIALAKAIAEGLDGENVSREEVFALLSE
jgi:predicted RNase H-like HicB family nuclease